MLKLGALQSFASVVAHVLFSACSHSESVVLEVEMAVG